ncbi:MAG: Teichoic-acid-transporting ATPase [Verrucomicrobiaceae bacterium]|nr:Teichoic-acid-transporting ATPase [Verrucomicrobiaceae bacterium]
MSDAIIIAENIGKRYVLNHQASGGGYQRFSEAIVQSAKGLIQRSRKDERRAATEDFWALKDVSFEIKRGEVVGIIGRNGAGKSTLLKILSRITEPTTGRITLKGRVASLLEVGTGFHPELSGRENIYLNGAILGMARAEIKAKFDEIVAFAEIEKFLDTPVKRYSSGMYVRLAFAVAAHLEPEILIVDEVLAVGDAQFQKKCLGKMQDVAQGGRTVLFVSHNMTAVEALCNRAILLNSGTVSEIGPAKEVLKHYQLVQTSSKLGRSHAAFQIDASLFLQSLSCIPAVLDYGESLQIDLELTSPSTAILTELSLLFYNETGQRVAIADLRSTSNVHPITPGNPCVWRVKIKTLNLVEGTYSLGLFYRSTLSRGDHYDLASITILPRPSNGNIVPYAAHYRGSLELDYDFVQISADKQAPSNISTGSF